MLTPSLLLLWKHLNVRAREHIGSPPVCIPGNLVFFFFNSKCTAMHYLHAGATSIMKSSKRFIVLICWLAAQSDRRTIQTVFPNSIRESLRKHTGGTESQCVEGSLHPPPMPLQRSAGRSAWIVIVAANRIQERPDDATWGPGRVELNGCQALKAHAACEQTHKGWTRPLRGPSYRLSPSHGGRLKIK